MKFFTPELFERFGSQEDEIADAADAEWERAGARYRRHLKKVLPQVPESLRRFVQDHDLHDAQVFGPARLSMQTIPWGTDDVVIVTYNSNTMLPQQDQTMTVLQYRAAAEPVVAIPLRSPAFHEGQTIWLYDEIDVVAPGVFSHEILLSDGRVIHVKYHEFRFLFAPVIPVSQATAQTEEKRKPTPRPPKAASA